MNAIRKFIVLLFAMVFGAAMSITVCIKGWGLEPKSWWWIIGMYFIGQVITQILVEIGKRDDK